MTNGVATVVEFIHGLQLTDVPGEVLGHARRSLLDLVGVAAAGTLTENSRIVRDHVARFEGPGERGARLLFDGRRVSVAGAAMANAATIDAFDAHDGHRLTKGHAGAVVLPAALALEDAFAPSDSAEFLVRLVLGYEIGCRAGIALHATAADYHSSGAWTALAAAAIFARGLGLSRAATAHALGAAEYYGPRSQMMRCIDSPTMVKDGATFGARAGVTAALLAADGFTGAPAVTVLGDEVAGLWSDLGSRWYVSEQYLKPYGVCRWAQPAIRAALELREGIDPATIDRAEIATFHAAARLAVRHPETSEEAQYSLPWPVAAALVTGTVSPRHLTTGLGDPAVLALADRIVVTESDAANAAFPGERLATVTLVLRDGRRLSCGPVAAEGDPEAPLSDARVEQKFRQLSASVLGPAAVERILAACVAAGGTGPAAELIEPLYAAPHDAALRPVA